MERSMQRTLSPPQYAAIAAFRHQLRRFLSFSEGAAAAAGLPTQQHQALLAIAGHTGATPPTVGTIAEQLIIAPQTAAELVSRMAEAGLVQKEPSPTDRRRLALMLTGKAAALLAALTETHVLELEALAPALARITAEATGTAARTGATLDPGCGRTVLQQEGTALMLEVATTADMDAHVGTELGQGDWLTITQAMIDTFAEATGDHQWIHVDVERAKREMPGGRTIAHGYLTLSLLPQLGQSVYRIKRRSRGLNYGSNKVRFTSMVPADSRVRARQRLLASEKVEGGRRLTVESTIEIDGQTRPALVAETISLVFD